ncbi:MAG: hypothetical protein K0R25_1259 [Rickettsiaceae bacterium]|nr:hypothetical protein [Rickettsiaceae bacterium]
MKILMTILSLLAFATSSYAAGEKTSKEKSSSEYSYTSEDGKQETKQKHKSTTKKEEDCKKNDKDCLSKKKVKTETSEDISISQ